MIYTKMTNHDDINSFKKCLTMMVSKQWFLNDGTKCLKRFLNDDTKKV